MLFVHSSGRHILCGRTQNLLQLAFTSLHFIAFSLFTGRYKPHCMTMLRLFSSAEVLACNCISGVQTGVYTKGRAAAGSYLWWSQHKGVTFLILRELSPTFLLFLWASLLLSSQWEKKKRETQEENTDLQNTLRDIQHTIWLKIRHGSLVLTVLLLISH